MLGKRLVVGLLGIAFASVAVGSDLMATEMRLVDAAAPAPCEPELGPPNKPKGPISRPKPPTGLRIIPGDAEISGPYADSESSVADVEPRVEAAASGIHAYFDALSLRSDCMVAYHMRSGDQLDRLETVKSGISEKGEMRFPVTYDSAVDAALFKVDPRVGSTDAEGKRLAMPISEGSMLLTWDLRFDGGHTYVGDGYLGRHKTYMIGWRGELSGDNRWLGFKTEYINAAQAKKGVAELYAYMIGPTYLGPGTSLGRQSLIQPNLGTFFIEPNTWTRVWVFLEDIGQPVSYVSIWVADTTRGPVQLHHRNAVVVPPGGINKFWFEYDTSGEDADNPEMRSWNRNFVVLKNIAATSVSSLLQRPAP